MLTAIVTGAGSGIGRATALKLAGAGYAVALVGRTADKLQRVAAEIEAAHGTAFAFTADVSQADEIDSMVHRVVERFQCINVLVNNAGFAPSLPVVSVTNDQWHEVLNTNLSSIFYATRAVWPIMQKNGGGVIVNISSMSAKDPFPGLGAYAVAKVGVNMLSLVTAREGEAVNIRVHCIAPAGVDTPMLQKLIGSNKLDPAQFLQPEDVAAAVLDTLTGSLRYTSGDTHYLHRRL